jgi:prepilin-type processing-associated H-X9-DG protein
LVALLLPAIQKVRETANRTTCTNNLKQIGLALHSYHDVYRGFPPSATAAPNKHHSWMTFILPYMEQKTVFDQYDFTSNWYAASNKLAVRNQIKVFQCPSTPVSNRIDSTFLNKPACSDYNAIIGIDPNLAAINLIPPTPDVRGTLVKYVPSRLAQVTDGTSTTVVVTEDAGRPKLWNAGHIVPGGYVPGGGWADDQGPFVLQGSSYDGVTTLGPCAINCTNNKEIYSFHREGANALFADGSVKFLQADIAISVMAALVTRAGAEFVSGTEY